MWVEAATNGRNDSRDSRVNTALLLVFAVLGPASPIDVEMLFAVNITKWCKCASHAVRIFLHESPFLIACRQCGGVREFEVGTLQTGSVTGRMHIGDQLDVVNIHILVLEPQLPSTHCGGRRGCQ